MKKIALPITLLFLLSLVSFSAIQADSKKGSVSQSPAKPVAPNVIIILTDDMTKASLSAMNQVNQQLVTKGTTFNHFFVSNALCCPSRTSTLRGQYAHNHGVLNNIPPDGGFQKAFSKGLELSTLATWLQSVGYRTALFGKYLNGYPDKDNTYIPPGWNEWNALLNTEKMDNFSYNYRLNQNGQLAKYGDKPTDYMTDVLAEKTIDFIRRNNDLSTPLFMYLATTAPHAPAIPAPRHANLFPRTTLPFKPSFNESDVSTKPKYIQKRKQLNQQQKDSIKGLYRKQLRSLQAVDEAVFNIMQELARTGRLDNTYIFFTSDNGLEFGEHRLPNGKGTPYEEAISVPLVVRGPNIGIGREVNEICANIDLAPTIAELAHAPITHIVDGRSLVPLLQSGTVNFWRHSLLLEHWPGRHEASPDDEFFIPQYMGLRSDHYLYVEYEGGERELYDLALDPFELKNIYRVARPSLLQQLSLRLSQLKSCVGEDCRKAEDLTIDDQIGLR